MKNIISRGAEAVIIKDKNQVIKKRLVKGYRLQVLDERLSKSRTKKEFKLLEKASKVIQVPRVLKVNEKTKEIEMELIKGEKLSTSLDSLKNNIEICKQIGKNIAKLHDIDIIHGDLTTSNMIYSNNEVYFIDFGLGYQSSKVEDKAVDLHLIKQALEAKHFLYFTKFFSSVLEGYKISKNYNAVIKRLEAVEKRGRYKQSY